MSKKKLKKEEEKLQIGEKVFSFLLSFHFSQPRLKVIYAKKNQKFFFIGFCFVFSIYQPKFYIQSNPITKYIYIYFFRK